MEKIRYYCELPGDFWEDGSFMQMLKENMNPLQDENGRLQYDTMRKFDQVHPELAVLDPSEACVPFLSKLHMLLAWSPAWHCELKQPSVG